MKNLILPGFLLSSLLFLVSCSSDGSSSGTSASNSPAATTVSTSAMPGSSQSAMADVLRIGDTLSIQLTGVPLEEQQRFEQSVNDRGEIAMPLIGNFVAAGKTISALTATIINTYRERKIFNNPSVLIVALQRYINVGGEVRAPQRIIYTNDLTALKAISSCGYFTDYAEKKNIKILRGQEVIMFNAVEAQKNPALDIALQAGDQIQVARTIF